MVHASRRVPRDHHVAEVLPEAPRRRKGRRIRDFVRARGAALPPSVRGLQDRVPPLPRRNRLRRACEALPRVPARTRGGQAAQGARQGQPDSRVCRCSPGDTHTPGMEAGAKPGSAPDARVRAAGQGGRDVRPRARDIGRAQEGRRRQGRALPRGVEHRRTRRALATGVPVRVPARR